MGTRRALWELWIVALAAGAGLADAVVGGQADLATIFGAVCVLALVAAVSQRLRRNQITVRKDIGAWLRRTADTEATSPGELADRVLAAARARVDGVADPTGQGHHR